MHYDEHTEYATYIVGRISSSSSINVNDELYIVTKQQRKEARKTTWLNETDRLHRHSVGLFVHVQTILNVRDNVFHSAYLLLTAKLPCITKLLYKTTAITTNTPSEYNKNTKL